MNKIHLALSLLLIACSGIFAQKKSSPDIIIYNAKITTLSDHQPDVEAVAIEANKIVAIGKSASILNLKTKKTQIIDAKGSRIIPGLFDSHLHVIRGGRFFNTELRWDGVTSLKKALAMLKEQAQRTPKGQWVRIVGGWNEYQFEEKRLPTLQEVNEASGDVPTFILYLYSKAFLNKAAVQALNLTEDTPGYAGGLMEKDNAGIPTGLLVAEPSALILYSTLARLPELSNNEKINSTLQFMTELNRLGVTGVIDAGGGFQNFPDDYTITDSLNKLGKISVRLPYFLYAQKKGSELQDYTKWIGMVDIHDHGDNHINDVDYFVSGGGEGILADAADFENFLFPRPELPATLESNLKPLISLFAKNQWPFRMHATYNESITRFLNVIEDVNTEIPLKAPWIIDHAEFISDENLQRIKRLGGGIAIQGRMAFQGEAFVHRYGLKPAGNTPPVKKMLELGIPVGLGTDGTRVASFNPWIAYYWLVSGKTIGGTQVLTKDNIVDRTTALKLLSFKGYELIKETQKGKIEPGYFADLVVLDRDIFSVGDEELKNTVSKLTIVDGKIVYGNDDFKTIAPAKLDVIPNWSPVKYFGGYQNSN